MDNVHIRATDNKATLCGSKEGSISFRHFAWQKGHVGSLPMCPKCLTIIDDLLEKIAMLELAHARSKMKEEMKELLYAGSKMKKEAR